MGNIRLLAVALCATLALSGCAASGASQSAKKPSNAARPSMPYSGDQDPELASADELPFNKQGLLECDGTLLGLGADHQDLGRGADPSFSAPVLIGTARSASALPVFLMKNSKIYNESGDRITCAQFCAHMIMDEEIHPVRAWRLTIRRDDSDRMTLVKATPVASN